MTILFNSQEIHVHTFMQNISSPLAFPTQSAVSHGDKHEKFILSKIVVFEEQNEACLDIFMYWVSLVLSGFSEGRGWQIHHDVVASEDVKKIFG